MAGSTWHLGGLGLVWDIGTGSAVQVWPPCLIHLMYQQGLYARESRYYMPLFSSNQSLLITIWKFSQLKILKIYVLCKCENSKT